MSDNTKNTENENSFEKGLVTLGTGLVVIGALGGGAALNLALPLVGVIGGLGAIQYINNNSGAIMDSAINSSISTKVSIGVGAFVGYKVCKFTSFKTAAIAGGVSGVMAKALISSLSDKISEATENLLGKNSAIESIDTDADIV